MATFTKDIANAYSTSKSQQFDPKDWKTTVFEELMMPTEFGEILDTCVPVNVLKEFGKKLFSIPETFTSHS